MPAPAARAAGQVSHEGSAVTQSPLSTAEADAIVAKDEQYIMRPWTHPKGEPVIVARAKGCVVTDVHGKRLKGAHKPSSEFLMHELCYVERPDVGAVVHAHPTNCIAFSLAGVSLAQCLLPEIVFTFGSIPTTAYTTPTTEEVPNEIRKWLRDFDAMILDPTCADPLSRRSVRVSMGEVLHLPFARIEPWPEGLAGLAGHMGHEWVTLANLLG